MHGWIPQVGKQYYAVLFVEGSGAGVADDPTLQWHQVDTGGINSSYDEYRNGPAHFVDIFGNAAPPPGDGTAKLSLAFSYKYLTKFRNVDPTTALSSGDLGDWGATGIFEFGLEPEAAVVYAGITVRLKKRLPPGAIAGSITLAGSLTISIVELDPNGEDKEQVASVQFSAGDFDGALGQYGFTEVYQKLSSPALVLAGHRYVVRFEGGMDETGEFKNWVVGGITNGIRTAGYGDNDVYVKSRAGIRFTSPTSAERPFVTTTDSERAGVWCKLHALKFDRDASVVDPTGKHVATIKPYILDPNESDGDAAAGGRRDAAGRSDPCLGEPGGPGRCAD